MNETSFCELLAWDLCAGNNIYSEKVGQMSRLSFKTFCIEFYSNHTHRKSDEVYQLFAESGLLELLDSDYEDLCGMSMEYLMQFFDEFLE